MTTKEENIMYDTSDPIDRLFTTIDLFTEVAGICNILNSTEQKADMAYIILQNTNKFSSGLAKWDTTQTKEEETAVAAGTSLPSLDWNKFKIHFREVHKGI